MSSENSDCYEDKHSCISNTIPAKQLATNFIHINMITYNLLCSYLMLNV